MQTYLLDNKSDSLIVLFDGWGMDYRPYRQIKSSCDVLFVYDYSNLDFSFDFSKYEKKSLLTFSAGVFMAAFLKEKLPEFDLKIAVNGTLYPLDCEKGICAKSLDEMEKITIENALDFRKKLISDSAHLETFNKFQPHRDLKSSLDELAALKKFFENSVEYEYDRIIIGNEDSIIPSSNQLRAWDCSEKIKVIDGGHFLFYNFESFDEIIRG